MLKIGSKYFFFEILFRSDLWNVINVSKTTLSAKTNWTWLITCLKLDFWSRWYFQCLLVLKLTSKSLFLSERNWTWTVNNEFSSRVVNSIRTKNLNGGKPMKDRPKFWLKSLAKLDIILGFLGISRQNQNGTMFKVGIILVHHHGRPRVTSQGLNFKWNPRMWRSGILFDNGILIGFIHVYSRLFETNRLTKG